MNAPKNVSEASAARESGERLKRAIHAARAMAGIDSDAALSLKARVHYDTLMNWYSGRTVPRPAAVRQIADALGVSYVDLLAAYDGREPAALPLEQAVAELIVEIRAAVVDERLARADLMRAITGALGATISAPDPVPVMDPPSNRQPVSAGRGVR